MATETPVLEDLFPDEIPELPGWVSLPALGAQLEVTRQRLFQMKGEGKLLTIHQIRGAGSRPALLVVRTEEAGRLLAEQAAARKLEAGAGNAAAE